MFKSLGLSNRNEGPSSEAHHAPTALSVSHFCRSGWAPIPIRLLNEENVHQINDPHKRPELGPSKGFFWGFFSCLFLCWSSERRRFSAISPTDTTDQMPISLVEKAVLATRSPAGRRRLAIRTARSPECGPYGLLYTVDVVGATVGRLIRISHRLSVEQEHPFEFLSSSHPTW